MKQCPQRFFTAHFRALFLNATVTFSQCPSPKKTVQQSPSPVDFVFRFRYRLRCLFEISEKNSAMGTTFFYKYKNERKLHEDTFTFIFANLHSIISLFRANNTGAHFWILFAMLPPYVVVTSELSQRALFVCLIIILDHGYRVLSA